MSRSLDDRLGALAGAVELADGRLEPADVAHARAVVERAGRRLGLGVETTVVALAGPTGAGKSTLFNALAGAELVAATRRRPTTSSATAAVWGDVPDPLLDWLEVPLRHRIGDPGDDPLALLDLPDFDSVEARHREEVDRLVQVVDLMVWVVDPQKYADASLHEAYLRPLAAHAAQMLVVLNQADTLPPGGADAARGDLARLLERDGLPKVPVLAVSAATRDGLPQLQKALRDRVARREAATQRLSTDVRTAATALGASCADGNARPPKISRADRDQVVGALANAAGVPAVVRAVDRSHRRRGALATGWPLVRWVRRLRPDPLGRLRLGSAGGPDEDVRTSLPGPTAVQQSGVASASRAFAATASRGLPDPWPALARRAATASEDALPGRLDRAVAGADLKVRTPRWWTLASLAQRLLALVALAGVLWLVVIAALGWLQLGDAVPVPDVEGFPLPTLMLAGGLLLGLVLAALTRWLNRIGGRRRARRAQRALHARVEEVARDDVLAPVEEELTVRERLCARTVTAAGR